MNKGNSSRISNHVYHLHIVKKGLSLFQLLYSDFVKYLDLKKKLFISFVDTHPISISNALYVQS